MFAEIKIDVKVPYLVLEESVCGDEAFELTRPWCEDTEAFSVNEADFLSRIRQVGINN